MKINTLSPLYIVATHFINVFSFGQSYGPNNPSMIINTGVTNQWTAPTGAATNDLLYTSNINQGVSSDLTATGYNYNMLPTDIVTGI